MRENYLIQEDIFNKAKEVGFVGSLGISTYKDLIKFLEDTWEYKCKLKFFEEIDDGTWMYQIIDINNPDLYNRNGWIYPDEQYTDDLELNAIISLIITVIELIKK